MSINENAGLVVMRFKTQTGGPLAMKTCALGALQHAARTFNAHP